MWVDPKKKKKKVIASIIPIKKAALTLNLNECHCNTSTSFEADKIFREKNPLDLKLVKNK